MSSDVSFVKIDGNREYRELTLTSSDTGSEVLRLLKKENYSLEWSITGSDTLSIYSSVKHPTNLTSSDLSLDRIVTASSVKISNITGITAIRIVKTGTAGTAQIFLTEV